MSFKLSTLTEELKKSVEGEDIIMESYLETFRNICVIFEDLGTMFGFVNREIRSKLKIVEEFLDKNNVGRHYTTLERMIEFEVTEGLVRQSKPPSGCRTVLRLHRSLEFIARLFNNLSDADMKEKLAPIAQKCYETTLAKHHGYLIQKAANLAMYSLPTVEKMFVHCLDSPDAIPQLVKEAAIGAQRVYDITHKMLEAKDLLNLP